METYAVFVKTTEHVPGDQRSIDYPGHGYGAHSVERTEVIEFNSKELFVAWINNQESTKYGKKSYRAFKITPVKVSTKVEIQID